MSTVPDERRPLDGPLRATHDEFLASRPPGADEDVHMLPAIVDRVIERCSPPGGLVFDPFAGFGTTLERAVGLGRRALGVELLPERVHHVRQQVSSAQVVEGDARELLRVLSAEGLDGARGAVDLVLTSPPYMTENDHDEDPLSAYELLGGDYRRYLRELGEVAQQCALLLRPGGYVVWNVADIHHAGHTTHLTDDVAAMLSRHLAAVDVVDIIWDRLPHDLVADALLVFRHPAEGVLRVMPGS